MGHKGLAILYLEAVREVPTSFDKFPNKLFQWRLLKLKTKKVSLKMLLIKHYSLPDYPLEPTQPVHHHKLVATQAKMGEGLAKLRLKTFNLSKQLQLKIT